MDNSIFNSLVLNVASVWIKNPLTNWRAMWICSGEQNKKTSITWRSRILFSTRYFLRHRRWNPLLSKVFKVTLIFSLGLSLLFLKGFQYILAGSLTLWVRRICWICLYLVPASRRPTTWERALSKSGSRLLCAKHPHLFFCVMQSRNGHSLVETLVLICFLSSRDVFL